MIRFTIDVCRKAALPFLFYNRATGQGRTKLNVKVGHRPQLTGNLVIFLVDWLRPLNPNFELQDNFLYELSYSLFMKLLDQLLLLLSIIIINWIATQRNLENILGYK